MNSDRQVGKLLKIKEFIVKLPFLCVVTTVLAVTLISPALADKATDAQARVDGLSDRDIFDLVRAWFAENADDCRLAFTDEQENRFEEDFKAHVFHFADVAVQYRPALDERLHDRIDDLLEARMETGQILVEPKGGSVFVHVVNCS